MVDSTRPKLTATKGVEKVPLNQEELKRAGLRRGNLVPQDGFDFVARTFPASAVRDAFLFATQAHLRKVVGKGEGAPGGHHREPVHRIQTKEPDSRLLTVSMDVGPDVGFRKSVGPWDRRRFGPSDIRHKERNEPDPCLIDSMLVWKCIDAKPWREEGRHFGGVAREVEEEEIAPTLPHHRATGWPVAECKLKIGEHAGLAMENLYQR